MFSGQWFQKKDLSKLHKITHTSMKNRDSTPSLRNLVKVNQITINMHKNCSKSMSICERRQK